MKLDDQSEEMCPVCKEDPELCGYTIISGGMAMFLCCKKCGVLYVPKSLQQAMSEVNKGDGPRIIVPHTKYQI